MKEVLYKKEFSTYSVVKHKNSTPFPFLPNSLSSEELDHYQRPTKKHPLFLYDERESTEESFVENFANQMCDIHRENTTIVVERCGDKVSIKLFQSWKHRRAGVSWFKQSKNVNFISVNKKTGDVYVGDLTNYHLKRKCRKRIRRNYFVGEPLNSLASMINGAVKRYTVGYDTPDNTANDVLDVFINEIDPNNKFEDLNRSDRLFKFYLQGRGIKYPNNFNVYQNNWFGPELRKSLKRTDNKMVDALMDRYGFKGKQIKKAMHQSIRFEFGILESAIKLFGNDWMNQDPELILACLNWFGHFYVSDTLKDLMTHDELKRVFDVFRGMVMYDWLDAYSFNDHLRFYEELKRYEPNLKWTCNSTDKSSFRYEHLDWVDRVSRYKNGIYYRIYPEYTYDLISTKIIDGDDTYYPVLLDNTDNYNNESFVQSNCVKGYVGKSSAIIISLRKGDQDSTERATIEYKLSKHDDKVNIERVQTLGRFNNRLEKEWDSVLFKLDERMLYYINDKQFETVKIKKVCQNGIELLSDSDWNDYGHLIWTVNGIN